MTKYTATLDSGEAVEIEAPYLGEAVDEAIWVYSDGAFVLSVEESGTEHGGSWILVGDDSYRPTQAEYPSKEAAMANADDGESIWIAIPKAS